MNNTPRSNRLHIAVFGRRNSGKSSLVNALTGQDTGSALRDLRVALNLLDLLAYAPRVTGVPQRLLRQVVSDVGDYFCACLKAGERLPMPMGLQMTMDRTRRALNANDLQAEGEARVHLLHALSGLRLALLPGVEFIVDNDDRPHPQAHIEGAPL